MIPLGSVRRKRPVISCRECHRRKQKCDRRQPCAHCVRRNKRDACMYELNDDSVPSVVSPIELGSLQTNSVPKPCSYTESTTSNIPKDEFRLLGYANNTKGTQGIIHSLGELTPPVQDSHTPRAPSTSQYASAIRGLPSRGHVEILVQAFFKNVAWHYDIVDEATFRSQLSLWTSLSYHQLRQAPHGLPVNLQSFPALLLQVLAQALLFQPMNYDASLDDLKYAADMNLSDRAAEYSEAGHQFALSFGKGGLTVTIIEAELLRVCFQKTTGAVIEAWHTLGTTIRNAQELGLHLIGPEPTLYQRTEKLSDRELGHRAWFNLHLWDAHMAVVLGRPISTTLNPDSVPLPMSWSRGSVVPETPQPRDVILCGYHTAYKFLQNISELENMEDYNIVVQNIHARILTNMANLPAWAVPQRQRTNEPPWLSAALETMFTNLHFVLFALHRPFVFADTSSREMAFSSAVQILDSQARLFDQTEPLQYKAFSLVLATFDAMVLIAALHIRFPDEFMEHLPTTKRNLDWGLNRLDVLRARNHLAGSCFKVVQRLCRRMLAAISPMPFPGLSHDSATSDTLMETDGEMSQVDWDNLLQTNLEDMLPPQPLHELLCNEATGVYLTTQTEQFDSLSPSQLKFNDGLGSRQDDIM